MQIYFVNKKCPILLIPIVVLSIWILTVVILLPRAVYKKDVRIYDIDKRDPRASVVKPFETPQPAENEVPDENQYKTTGGFGKVVAALTSISPQLPEAVKRLLKDRVAVYASGDLKGPPSENSWSNHPELHLYTAEQQRQCAPNDSAICRFIRQTKWNHFARKNIAYLVAIRDAAPDYIWDFDDDNISVRGLMKHLRSIWTQMAKLRFGLRATFPNASVVNPYPTLSSSDMIYPRGFPLQGITDTNLQDGELVRMSEQIPRQTVVFQAAADGNPDVDAIFRLTRNYGITFRSVIDALILDNHYWCPYNAQATLQKRESFFALYLPTTVSGRVSDIWRSYIGQALFRIFNYNIAFIRPVVVHKRSPHDLTSDLKEEWPLYSKAGLLVAFLREWTQSKLKMRHKTNMTAPELMIGLYAELVERGFVGDADLSGVRHWLDTLTAIGYQYPTIPTDAVIRTQVDSPPATRFPTIPNVFQTVHIAENHWRVIGPLRAFYKRIFPNFRFYLARPLSAADSRCQTPFVKETICWQDRRLNNQLYGTTAHFGYLDAVRYLRQLKVDAADRKKVPEMILWHHDDLLLNITSVHQFTTERHLWGAFSQSALYNGTALVNATLDDERDIPMLPLWSGWERGAVARLRRLFAAEPAFFRRHNNSICARLLASVERQTQTDDGDWSWLRQLVVGDEFSKRYIDRVVQTRQWSDFLLTHWAQVEAFNENLQLLYHRNIMLEVALRLALKCAHSVDEIEKKFTSFSLAVTYWSVFNFTTTQIDSLLRPSPQQEHASLAHPIKIGLSQDHLLIALAFRDATLPK